MISIFIWTLILVIYIIFISEPADPFDLILLVMTCFAIAFFMVAGNHIGAIIALIVLILTLWKLYRGV